MRKIIPLLVFFTFAGGIFAEFDADALPENLARRVKQFLDADTAKARGAMPSFSDEDLQKVLNAFKKDHSGADQRLFWLAEESYRRNAERVAAERIRYLYYAVLAALGIITAFTAMTYARARKSAGFPPHTPTAPEIAPAAPQTAPRRKSKPAKKRR